MTRSRKLFVASILLAGGYGLALFLGGLTETVGLWTATDVETATSDRGWLTTLKGFVRNGETATGTGQLVPESDAAVDDADDASARPRQPLEPPTWLAATPPTEPTEATTDSLAATTSAFAENVSTTPIATDETGSAGLSPHPSARITNVTTTPGDVSVHSASPWDRWPKWEPGAAKSTGGIAAATFESSESARPQVADRPWRATQAAFDNADAPLNARTEADFDNERTHVVVDGDSLAKLADRYLDDPRLDDEIFRLNRDVLTSPDLLPIGVELRIPAGRTAESHRATPLPYAPDANRSTAPAGMVPVEWTPSEIDAVPRAQLLPPIPAGRSD